ncbi:MAG: hypothetical protein ACKO96_33245, partial [Flammeovirgaceae bacterium]
MKLKSVLQLEATRSHDMKVSWPGNRKWEDCLSLMEELLVKSDTPLTFDDILSKIRLKPGTRVNRDVTSVLYCLEKAGVVRRVCKDGIPYYSAN